MTGGPTKTRVVNIRTDPQGYDVYIGRAGLGFDGTFGNPYRLGYHGNREEVVEKFRKWFYNKIQSSETYLQLILTLRGQRLGCFCAPKPCHGDVIAAYLNNLD